MSTFDPFESTNEEIAAVANFRAPVCMALALAATNSVAFAQPSGTAIPVTADNYNRAQTDVYFGQTVKAGNLGKFRHGRELAPPVQQGIVRPNRDTLYSFAVLDLAFRRQMFSNRSLAFQT
jgi:hypothetical protein